MHAAPSHCLPIHLHYIMSESDSAAAASTGSSALPLTVPTAHPVDPPAATSAQTPLVPSSGAQSKGADAAQSANTAPPGGTIPSVISGDAAALLSAFIARAQTQQHYTNALVLFKGLLTSLNDATTSLSKFKGICKASTQEHIILPRSLRLDLVTRVNFTSVSSQPRFYEEDEKELRKIEEETSKRIYDTMIKAKEKHIKHLQLTSTSDSFLTRITTQYSVFVTRYADTLNPMVGTGTQFPTAQAIKHFNTNVLTELNKVVMDRAEVNMEQYDRAEEKAIEDTKNKERVMDGAKDGTTIAEIANRAATDQVASLKQQLAELRREVSRLSIGATAASPSHTPATDSNTMEPGARSNSNIKSFKHNQSRGRKHGSGTGNRIDTAIPPGTTSDSPEDSNKSPLPNTKGRDRPAEPSNHKSSSYSHGKSSGASQHAREHHKRNRDSDSEQKNGKGGDRKQKDSSHKKREAKKQKKEKALPDPVIPASKDASEEGSKES